MFLPAIVRNRWKTWLLVLGTGLACAASGRAATRQTSVQIVVIDAPSNLGLRPPAPGVGPGVKNLAAALRKTGLIKRLGARDAGQVEPPGYSPDPDPVTRFRNGTSLPGYSVKLADQLVPLITGGDFVLVLGGDCSILLGTGLALHGLGRYGLAFIDAHDDFSFARPNTKYFGLFVAAGTDLALVTGHGPNQLSDIRGESPYFREQDVIQIGLSREKEDSEFFQTETFDRSKIQCMPVDQIAGDGAPAIGKAARAKLERMNNQGFWIHLDADVLDAKVMPAVDSPNQRGLSFEQLQQILSVLLSSPKARGLEVTIYDPTLDPDGRYAKGLAHTIEQSFAASGRFRLARPESSLENGAATALNSTSAPFNGQPHEAEINLGPTDHVARAIGGRVTIYQDLAHIAFDVAGDRSPWPPFAESYGGDVGEGGLRRSSVRIMVAYPLFRPPAVR
jgi:arginase